MHAVDLKELELLEGRSTPGQFYPPMLHLDIGAVATVDLKRSNIHTQKSDGRRDRGINAVQQCEAKGAR